MFSELPFSYQLLYRRAFWRVSGFSGEVVCDNFHSASSPIFNLYDYSKPINQLTGEIQPGLVAFINADCAIEWSERTVEERKQAIFQQLIRWFSSKKVSADEICSPLIYREKNWSNEEWTRGCPVAVAGTGVLWSTGHQLR